MITMGLPSKTSAIVVLALCAAAAHAKPLVRAKPYAHASLTSDGPWLANPTDPDPTERSTLELENDTGKRMLVTTYVGNGFLQLYLDRAGLSTVAIVDTELHPAGAKSQAGARLGQGMRIDEATAQRDGTSRVTIHWEWDDARIDVTGLVATAALGTRHEPGVIDGSAPHPPRPKADMVLPASFQLLDGAAGQVFATRNGKQPVPATAMTTFGAYTLVSVDLRIDGFVLTGWIRSQLVKPASPVHDREIVGGLLGGSRGDSRDIPVDLYDAIGGRVIGHLQSAAGHKPVEHDGTWTRYDLVTQFGVAPVWANEAVVQWSAVDSYRAPAATGSSPRTATPSRVTVGKVRVQGDYEVAVARRYVKRQGTDLVGCYDTLPLFERVVASVDVEVSLDASGAASNVSTNATPAMAEVASCVHRVLSAVEFPKPKDGKPVRFTMTLAFAPT